MLGWVIDVAADGADILSGSFLGGEFHFGKDSRHGSVKV